MFDYPIIPHRDVDGADCCGCLIVVEHANRAEIRCNECNALVGSVAVEDVERVMAELARTDTVSSTRCTHCGALNTFPGWSVIEAFVCSHCDRGVHVVGSVQ